MCTSTDNPGKSTQSQNLFLLVKVGYIQFSFLTLPEMVLHCPSTGVGWGHSRTGAGYSDPVRPPRTVFSKEFPALEHCSTVCLKLE